ncbi:endonuclease NucS domain-containing protein [Thalassoglobus polymorphus]|uniref:Endonuclease NucS C-terminal domain-containing protein n=1 Tax=Thalassoglobus polymorphus TaxID=2527994 RepID=A0A517QQV3_9PLAN|nr:endonuclease NucS domain-containing protein [Thalassoglobus polymorphus]QDT34017.1 hypothetical protein Mal48_32740 [Thalassoglobus polymorphus]
MPIEVGLWKMGETPQRVEFSAMETEQRLEDVLFKDLSILDPNLLLIGRQVPTAFGKFIDLLAIDREGNLTVIELKRDKTPREVVAQVLDYGSWVRHLEDDDIASIFDAYTHKYYPNEGTTSLDEAFCKYFSTEEMPEALNEVHELVVVAAELDDSTERIINYLTDFGVAVNAVFFRFFKDGDSEYISRAWLIEPDQVEAKVVEKREKLPWNGEYYVSFGGAQNRDWDEACKYGFVSAGGGSWYTKSLGMLSEDARIWVNIPGEGYVGVGRVVQEAAPIDGFLVDDGEGNKVPITGLALKISQSTTAIQDPEKAEHLVGVEWIKTVPVSNAIREKGFFGNQNSAAKPRSKKWPHTVERLKARLGVND